MRKVCLVGHRGGMGRRYQAVLKHLGYRVVGHDLADGYKPLRVRIAEAQGCDGVLIATPTDAHIASIHEYMRAGRPILCEKPISRDPFALRALLDDVQARKAPLQMVRQYERLVEEKHEGLTEYDYFRSGSDGLHWDCISIVSLAKGTVRLASESPLWKCQINGRRLSLADMDRAYVEMVDEWLKAPRDDSGRLMEWHLKVAQMKASA